MIDTADVIATAKREVSEGAYHSEETLFTVLDRLYPDATDAQIAAGLAAAFNHQSKE